MLPLPVPGFVNHIEKGFSLINVSGKIPDLLYERWVNRPYVLQQLHQELTKMALLRGATYPAPWLPHSVQKESRELRLHRSGLNP